MKMATQLFMNKSFATDKTGPPNSKFHRKLIANNSLEVLTPKWTNWMIPRRQRGRNQAKRSMRRTKQKSVLQLLLHRLKITNLPRKKKWCLLNQPPTLSVPRMLNSWMLKSNTLINLKPIILHKIRSPKKYTN